MRMKENGKQGFTLVEIMIVVGIIGLLAALALPAFIKARTISQSKACINNLRIMDAAKEQAAMEYRWRSGKTIDSGTTDETNVLAYVKRNQIPDCPGSGTYAWNSIGASSSCSVGAPGVHTL